MPPPKYRCLTFAKIIILLGFIAWISWQYIWPDNVVKNQLKNEISAIEEQRPSEEKEVYALAQSFSNGDIDTVENALQKAHKEKRMANTGRSFDSLVLNRGLCSNYSNDDCLNHILKWMESYPDSPFGYMALSQHLSAKAWDIRSNAWAKYTPSNRMAEFVKLQKEALAELETAKLKDPTVSTIYTFMAGIIGTISGDTIEAQEAILAQAQDAGVVDDFGVHHHILMTGHRPRWGGTREGMFAYARAQMARYPDRPLMGLLLVNAHIDNALYMKKDERKAYYNQPEVWADISGAYKAMINAYPHAAVWVAQYANRAEKAGKRDLAMELYNRAFYTDPYHFQTYLDVADMYIAGRAWDGAEKIVNEYLALTEDFWPPFNFMSYIKIERGQYEQAIEYADKGLAIDQNVCSLWVRRGIAKYYLKQYEAALADHNEALKRHPVCRYAFKQRARVYEAMGKMDDAALDRAVINRMDEENDR